MTQTEQYWFPKKRVGFGWGAPRAWQGWLVLLAYVAALPVSAVLFPDDAPVALLITIGVLTPALLWVCVRKGEPLH